ncbi:MAG TPA: RNA-binding protein, partial [Flavobacteriales bacterium]|nr:RNA-binding protein [Flavobacteriales bacterium]
MKNALLFLAGLGASAAQAQDNCTTAVPITAGTYTVTLIDGTAPPMSCAGGQLATHGEWSSYTPAEDHSLTVT